MGNTASLSLRRRRRAAAGDLLYTKPSGLYSKCLWDEKHVARLIVRGDLAPRHPGQDERSARAPEECPICMLNYPSLNFARCCQARLCTECYLQVRPPRHSKEPCPFCKHRRLEAGFRGARDPAELEREADDARRASAAMRRAQEAAAAAAPSVGGGGGGGAASVAATAATSDASSSAASAAAQFGNSAASDPSDEGGSGLSAAPASADAATMRRVPFCGSLPYSGALSGAYGAGATMDEAQRAIFEEEREERDIAMHAFNPPPPRYTAEGRGAFSPAPFISRYSDELSEAIRRSIIEQ